MSGVRNLRAMFEQKGENNPPDRGRSPGPSGVSVGSPSPTHSPRPLSKVRTTFVAIEKDGRLGLRREPSGDSVSVSSQKLSDATDATTPQPVPEKPEPLAENMAKNVSAFKANLSQESIPESPVQAAPPKSPTKSSPKKQSSSPPLAPNPNPDKVTDEEETRTKLRPGNPTEKSVSRGSSVAPASGRSSASTNSSKTKTATATKPAPKAVSTTAKPVSKAPKSPKTLKPASSTAKPTSSTSSLASQKRSTPASSREREAPKKAAATTAKPAATSTKKPASLDLPSSGAGSVKPKAKSPTRPVKLPSSLTAPTAASASKLGNSTAAQPPRQSLSRASGNAQHHNVSSTTYRSPSRQSLSSLSTTSNTNGLKRQTSAASRPRPSFGPPPKPTARDHPIIKRDGHVDEGFLARMMRPTASSSSKTADKAPVTPPRKPTTPSASQKRVAAKDGEGIAKKAVSRVQSATNKAKAATESTKPADKKTPSAKEVAPVVAQAETAEAAIETAKVSADTAIKEGSVSSEKSSEQVTTVPAVTEDPEKVEDIEDVVQPALEPAAEIYAAKSETGDVQEELPVSEGANEVVPQSEAAETTEEVKAEGQLIGETF
ncbi:uncharacterized protein F4812DRAFT_463056 [Daldinia caldariorum]|uniref:uncharacterized protein n=1 Tax=Daldinia caldariorum TaxID=326644 RepID=UPI00200735FC|nr:uncharacterized protein F4812DRAFT_463056 [Daldinia caldariorum]KAI1463999.1 hypothetical protein F4812DRAFT_463056 [Daldinia caldariorum]